MKLLSLHITAFGGIEDRDYRFSDGVTEILDRNGAGKSTLAAFIKMMFFGLDGAKKTTANENEFLLYTPWSGGRFGGSLTFLTEGRTYRIERFYERAGGKTPQESLRIYDEASGQPTDRFGDEPGRQLFGVDGDSFQRTVYFSSRGKEARNTPSISAKLVGAESDVWDMSNYEGAIKLLEKKRNEIRTKKKQKNGQKLLDLAEGRLADTERAIEALANSSDDAARAEKEAKEARAEAVALDSEIAACDAAYRETLRMSAEAEEREKSRRALLTAQEEAESALREITVHFPSGVPTEDELARLLAKESERAALLRQAEQEKPLPTVLPDDADIQKARQLVRTRKETTTKLDKLNAEATTATPYAVGHLYSLLLGGGLLTLLSSLPLLFLRPPIGGGLLALAVVLLSAAGILLRRRGQARSARQEEARQRDKEEQAAALAARAAHDALVALGLAGDAEEEALDALTVRVLEWRSAEKEAEARRTRAEELEKEIGGVLAQFRQLPDGRSAALAALSSLLRAYSAASLKRDHAVSALAAMMRQAPPPAEKATPEQLREALDTLRTRRDTATAKESDALYRAERAAESAERLDALMETRDALLETVESLKARLHIITTAADYLELARKELEARTFGGLRRHLDRYVTRLLGTSCGEALLDLSLSLSFLQNGEKHDAACFSTGQAAIAEVCLRLAITDELYGDAPPPLLLDDPFVALDEQNLQSALALLRELAKERQILYLTCHPSRALNP